MKKFFMTILGACFFIEMYAQIALSPYVESAIDGLTVNNVTIAENRLRNVISSMGLQSATGGRFVLACRVAALQREVSGTKLIQHLEITFAVGDDKAGTCFGSTSMEAIGIGNTEGQAMTSALKNIRANNELKKIVGESRQRIIDYYNQNGPAIIKKAKGLIVAQKWEEALFELAFIPEECNCYNQALEMMENVYETHLNHDASQLLAEAQALWSADPNPGPSADQAVSILGQIDPGAKCYPQAKALMNKIEARTKAVTDRNYRDEQAMQKARLKAVENVEKARIAACRAVAVAYAQSRPRVVHHYHSWW